MKAITLWQPWASLVAVGAKTIETRSWSTRYRGPIAIHAAKKDTDRYMDDCMELWTELGQHIGSDPPPRGAVVALAELVDVVPTENIRWVNDPSWGKMTWCQVTVGLSHTMVHEEQRPFGDYGPDRYAWLLRLTKRLRNPRPAAGKQGLWTWEVTK